MYPKVEGSSQKYFFGGESCVWGSIGEEGRSGQYLQLPLFSLNSATTQVLLVTLGSLTQAIKSEINFLDTHAYEYTHSIQTPLSTEVALAFKWPWHEAP